MRLAGAVSSQPAIVAKQLKELFREDSSLFRLVEERQVGGYKNVFDILWF